MGDPTITNALVHDPEDTNTTEVLHEDQARLARGTAIVAWSELLGTVSHELRSPLTAIKGYAATLLRHEQRLPREERREFLEAISQASERLQEVIDRLMEMSQLEAGAAPFERFPVDIERLVEGAVSAAQQRAERQAPGRFTFAARHEPDGAAGAAAAADGDSPLLVRGDARRLRSVLDRLLENAVKYSPPGGAIAVTTRRADDPVLGAMVEVEVRDSGMGIPPDHLERVFERFHRVDTRLVREADGLGLGLAIAKRIVELHGGAIWAESGPGSGSAFFVRLPLDATDGDDLTLDDSQRGGQGSEASR